MKLPSLRQVVEGSTQTFLRFPMVILNAAIGTVAALILIDFEGPPQETFLFDILLAALIGIPFLTALALVAEKRKLARPVGIVLQIAGMILLLGYALTLPRNLDAAPAMHLARFFLLFASMHLLVAWVPFSSRGEVKGFWHYNKELLLRILLAALYSMVLWIGLSIALVALKQLFGVDIPGKRYPELWILIAGLFNTWFFLAGVPGNLASLEARMDYPKGLKIFTQYILIPIILVYLVILYAYAGKIVVEWSWPKGWVSGLIIGFSTTGILSLLLLHPIREQGENVWIRTVSRWFYVVLIPLVVMLVLAIWRRIGEYGVTESRYLGVLVGLWLAAMVVYFLVSRAKSIKVIPASLFVIGLLISAGPWGMFSVSERDQVARLQTLLTQNKILVDGKVRTAPEPLGFDARKDICSIFRYLHDMHGYGAVQSWFAEPIGVDTTGTPGKGRDPRLIAKLIGIEYVDQWQGVSGSVAFVSADKKKRIALAGYDRLLGFEGGTLADSVTGLLLRMELPGARLSAQRSEPSSGVDSISIDLRPVLDDVMKDYGQGSTNAVPPERLSATAAGRTFRMKVYIRHVRFSRQAEGLTILGCEADVLVSTR